MITVTASSGTMRKTHPGNRRGHSPARMVGHDLASEKCHCGKDAAHVTVISGVVHGRTSPHLFFSLALVLCFLLNGDMAHGKNLPVYNGKHSTGRLIDEATPEELAAARGVESMFVEMMIQEMRKTVPENDIIPVSNGEKIYRQMLDSEYAKTLSNAGGLGIAEMVLAELKGKR